MGEGILSSSRALKDPEHSRLRLWNVQERARRARSLAGVGENPVFTAPQPVLRWRYHQKRLQGGKRPSGKATAKHNERLPFVDAGGQTVSRRVRGDAYSGKVEPLNDARTQLADLFTTC